MAELLDGNTDHINYAPLSHAQTVAMCRHLQEQIRILEAKIGDLNKGLQNAHEAVSDLKDTSGSSNSAIHNLQEGLKNTTSLVDSNRKELARTNGNVQKLQQGLEQTNNGLAALRDAQTVSNNRLEKVANDLAQTTGLAGKLQENIELKLSKDIQTLRDDLAKTNLDLRHLKADEEAVKEGLHEEREKVRDNINKIKNVVDDLGHTNTKVGILEQRLGDTTANAKATRQNLEDLNVATLKLHEDHENTKNNVNDLRSSVKKAHSHVKQVHETADRLGNALAGTNRKLEDNNGDTSAAQQHLEDLRSKVQALKDAQDRANTVIQLLRRDLAEVGATTEKVKAGLKEQSSLLLPNLSLDSAEARAATARHGSLLQTAPLGGTMSPRKPPSRNGNGGSSRGAAPNLMAWT
mmetsp:Transcript_69260/g.202789  ORF Transcript_69260/g.202789 Transcript_69260/m.202789 type:complete len:407 (-) Transcript_69260:26-1246(-)